MASRAERTRKRREKQRKDSEKVVSYREKDRLPKEQIYERELLKNNITLEQREEAKPKEMERKRRQKEKRACQNCQVPNFPLTLTIGFWI